MTDGERALGGFTSRFNKEISKEYGLYLYGSGASFPVKIEHIILAFEANSIGDVKGARKLAVEISHKMIERMNQDANLLKYLSSNPASINHVDLTIGFKDPKTPGSLNCVMVIGSRNKVVFSTFNEDHTVLRDLHKETFDEAEKIVQQEKAP